MNSKGVIPAYHHGFRAHKSVLSLLIEQIDDLTAALDTNKSEDVLFSDVSKAFDSVNLNLLLQKITSHGVGNLTTDWLRHFLTNRKFSTLVDNYQTNYIEYNREMPSLN